MRDWSRRSFSDIYLWAVILLGTTALAFSHPEWSREPEVFVSLIVLFGLAEYFMTRVRVGAITFSFPTVYAAFLLYGTPGAAWVAAAGTILANLARRRSWRVAWFNGAQFALTALLAGKLSLWWPGAPSLTTYILPLLVYLFLYYGANNLIVDGLLWLRLKVYHYADWLAKTRFEATSAAVSFAYSVLMLVLAPQQRGHDPLALTFFFLPLLTGGGFVRLLTNLSRFASQMATLMEVSTLVTFAPDEPQALGTALDHLESFDDYRYAAVYQVEGDDLALHALRGIPRQELCHVRIPIGEGLTGWAARQAAPVFAHDARQDPRNTIGEGVSEKALMLAAIPLVSSGQVMGVLTVGKERSHSIQPEDVPRLTIFANLLATIMRNLSLAEERERLLLVQERHRLAREIHDGLAQSLAGAILQMDRLERLLDSDPRATRKLLQHLREQLRENLLEVRRSIFNLRPSPLEANGLVETLRHEVQRLRDKGLFGAVEIRTEVRGEQRRLSGLVEDEVFRIAQEGLTNALRHAHATEVTVSLHFFADRLRLTIRDDGCGFLLADAIRRGRERESFGLVGMSERAERLGASFDVDSRPGAGTRMMIEIPLMGE